MPVPKQRAPLPLPGQAARTSTLLQSGRRKNGSLPCKITVQEWSLPGEDFLAVRAPARREASRNRVGAGNLPESRPDAAPRFASPYRRWGLTLTCFRSQPVSTDRQNREHGRCAQPSATETGRSRESYTRHELPVKRHHSEQNVLIKTRGVIVHIPVRRGWAIRSC